MLKPVLLIAFNWPRDASIGAVRPAKISKHLIRNNWRPVILTVKERYYENLMDEAGEAGDIVLCRTRCLPNPVKLYVSFKAAVLKLLGQEDALKETTDRGEFTIEPVAAPETFTSRVKRLVLSFLWTPDEYVGWLPFAIPQSVRAIRAHSIASVISTGPPFTAHLVGLAVKKLCGISWVADFRDPWWQNETSASDVQSVLSNRLQKGLEALVVRNADRVVCVTSAMTDHYRKTYPRLWEGKWITITNGFDEDEFHELGCVSRSSKFTISYLGSFEYSRSPKSFIRAAGELLKEGVLEKDRVNVKFIGKCRYADGESVQEMVDQAGLKDIVEIVDLLPRPDALREMLRSHVLLLLATQQRLQVPGKAYEYLAAGGHILAVTEEKGATADLINRVGWGAVVLPEDDQGMKRILKTWYAEYQGQAYEEPNKTSSYGSIVKEYEWSKLGARYASVLDECGASCGERT